MINLCQNTQESTVKGGQKPMLPALNIVINLVLCFFLYHVPSVYHAACFWWGALISLLKRGWFQLIPGVTSLLSAAAWCCPHFPRNSFLPPSVTAFWQEELFCEPGSSLDRCFWWRVHYLLRSEGEVRKRTSLHWTVCVQAGLAWLPSFSDSCVCGSSLET